MLTGEQPLCLPVLALGLSHKIQALSFPLALTARASPLPLPVALAIAALRPSVSPLAARGSTSALIQRL